MGHKTLSLNLSKSFITDGHTGASCGLQADKAKPQLDFFPENNNDGIYQNQLYNDHFHRLRISNDNMKNEFNCH